MIKYVTKNLTVWLEYPNYFRYAFCILLLLSVMINGLLLKESDLIGLYHLTIIAGGIAFWNKIWIQGIISGFVLFLRYYLDSNGFPHLSIFLFSWFTYFLITHIASIQMRNYLHTKKKSMDVIFALAKSLDSRDKYTAFHSENVAKYAEMIAKEMNIPKKQCEALYLGGLLHDIGKIGVPESILKKPLQLTKDEYEIMKQHPVNGYETIKHISDFEENGILDMVLYHHERYDGTGYPKGLKGDEIPFVARIMAVADSFDAMTSRRTYRTENDLEYAIYEIRKNQGTQFDPVIADVFLTICEREGGQFLSHQVKNVVT